MPYIVLKCYTAGGTIKTTQQLRWLLDIRFSPPPPLMFVTIRFPRKSSQRHILENPVLEVVLSSSFTLTTESIHAKLHIK